MKWLIPLYPKPPGKLITLGSILEKADDPETRLNRVLESDSDEVKALVTVDPQYVSDESVAVRRSIQASLSDEKSLLLKAMPHSVFGPGANVEGKLAKGVQTTVDALNVKARVFQAPQEHLDRYMDAAVAHPGVQYFMKKHHFSKALYLVVGVATAHELSVKETRTQESGLSARAGVDAHIAKVETGVEMSQAKCVTSEFEIGEECDFAYRLRAFTCHKYKGAATDKGDVSRGTLFGRRDDDEESEESDGEGAYVAKFNAFRGGEDISGSPGLPSF